MGTDALPMSMGVFSRVCVWAAKIKKNTSVLPIIFSFGDCLPFELFLHYISVNETYFLDIKHEISHMSRISK